MLSLKVLNLGRKVEAGFEVRREKKLNQKVEQVHDIFVTLNRDEIAMAIRQQNTPNESLEVIKPIFLYPSGKKKHRFCVIETTSEVRLLLLKKGSVTSITHHAALTITYPFFYIMNVTSLAIYRVHAR